MPLPEFKKELRRTTALVRKAFFDIIGKKIKDSIFLDLYAGEGGVGIEALKRGAGYVVFVEGSGKNAGLINKRLSECGFSNARVVVAEVGRFLTSQRKEHVFDIIFADPPYESKEYEILFENLPGFTGLKEGTIVCIEHFHKKILPEYIDNLLLFKRQRYGDTVLSFYRRKE